MIILSATFKTSVSTVVVAPETVKSPVTIKLVPTLTSPVVVISPLTRRLAFVPTVPTVVAPLMSVVPSTTVLPVSESTENLVTGVPAPSVTVNDSPTPPEIVTPLFAVTRSVKVEVPVTSSVEPKVVAPSAFNVVSVSI